VTAHGLLRGVGTTTFPLAAIAERWAALLAAAVGTGLAMAFGG
jgi:hypothetical protein